MLKRIVKKTLGLSGTEGLALFSFGAEAINRTALRNKVKDMINTIELTPEEKKVILKEKTRVFQVINSFSTASLYKCLIVENCYNAQLKKIYSHKKYFSMVKKKLWIYKLETIKNV